MRKSIIFLVALLCHFTNYSQTFDSKKLDRFFDSMQTKKDGMGMISIYKNNKQVYQKSIGYANVKTKKKADQETLYRIASISKTYTATIILQMIEEKKLSLTTQLSDYFPQVPNATKITIEDLLRHQSGLYNITQDENLRSWVIKKQTRKQMLDRIVKYPVDFQPKEKTSYSNTNYILLSYIAEKIDRKSFSSIVKKRIVRPLKLKRTHFGKRLNGKKNQALPFYLKNEKWYPITTETHLSAPMGAGGIVASTNDLAKFYMNVFGNKLFSKASLQQMTDTSKGMGLGISSMEYKGLMVFGHDGGIDGFSSFALHIPEKNLTLAITLNGSTSEIVPTVISILDIYFENDPTLKRSSTFSVSSKDLDKYLGIYVSKTFPAKVTITKKGNVLFAQAEGQPLFKLLAVKKDHFSYDSMGIKFSFNPPNEAISIFFRGNTHLFKRIR
ncbi:serine hydrolase domain-containing protein [Pseudotenacibaculum haliotis]|uniref:Serine hydrolase domain-containing protein n=1 Tax=Pseudotenacibaculum haliotis TaxID=1862138 RepID=A0ABW5LVQ3_9FLAO